jgi:predicted DNA-binding transcriptional regulator YafY
MGLGLQLPLPLQVRKPVFKSATCDNSRSFMAKPGTAWGIMVVDDAKKAKVETVRLRVKKGIAERFKAVSFHDSQQVKCLPHDEAEVCFEVSGAGEMIPWLMSWGPTLQVVEPQWLKDMMLTSLKETMDVYISGEQ